VILSKPRHINHSLKTIRKTGGGPSLRFTISGRNREAEVSPMIATLTRHPAAKSFRICSYAKGL
jgi:hypothetical protein